MNNFFSRFINVPKTNETKQIEVPELWEVRWTSRNGEYQSDTSPQVCGFYSKEEAVEFKIAVNNAFNLLKHSGIGTEVSLRRVS